MTHQNHTALFLKASTALLKSHQNVNKVKMQTLQQNFISRAFPNRAGCWVSILTAKLKFGLCS